MVNVFQILEIVLSSLTNKIKQYNATASVNGIYINLSTSYSSGSLVMQGTVKLQQSNELQITVYIGDYLIDTFTTQLQIPAGTYVLVYTIVIQDPTDIVSNAFGYAVANQLKSVSISTNASSYAILAEQNMLTFFLQYNSYPSSITIDVTFNLIDNTSSTGKLSMQTPTLPNTISMYATTMVVTYEL